MEDDHTAAQLERAPAAQLVHTILLTASSGMTLNEVTAVTGLPPSRSSIALQDLEEQRLARLRGCRWVARRGPGVPA